MRILYRAIIDILKKATSILACDGAADTLINKGYIPDIILGDLDSLSDENTIKYSNHILKKHEQCESTEEY